MKRKFRTAQIQMPVHEKKEDTVRYLQDMMAEVCENNVDIVCLPEMFCCPFINSKFPEYAEEEGGYLWTVCSELAKKHGVYLAAGTMPEVEYGSDDAESNNIYNTAYVFDRNGQQIAKHRKMHLFEIYRDGKVLYSEGDTLSAGNEITMFDTEFGKAGLIVCYDIRFIELSRIMKLKGMEFMIAPAAFNMITGPKHWELLIRSQAMFNQVYVLGTSLARDAGAGFTSWGHTMAVDPWGEIIGSTDEKPSVVYADIDLDKVNEVMSATPVFRQRREDIYTLKENK